MKREKNYQGNPVRLGFVYYPGEWKRPSMYHSDTEFRHPEIHIFKYSFYKVEECEGRFIQASDSVLDLRWQGDSGQPGKLYAGSVGYVAIEKLDEVNRILRLLGFTAGRFRAVLRVLINVLKMERLVWMDNTSGTGGVGVPTLVPWRARKYPWAWILSQEAKVKKEMEARNIRSERG